MTLSTLTVSVADLEREETLERDWVLTPEWLKAAFAGTEATPTGVPGRAKVQLFKNGREVLVQGKLSAEVELPCARTLDPARYELTSELTLILHKKSAGDPTLRRTRQARKPPRREREDGALPEAEVTSDTYSGDQIVLDEFVREQLLLEIPMFPLRSDLRSDEAAAIPAHPLPSRSGTGIDPRLLPLRAIAEKMKGSK